MPARKPSVGGRKNPLRVAGDPVPVVESVVSVAAVPLQRTAYTPREMRQMMISEFGDWLRTQTNKRHADDSLTVRGVTHHGRVTLPVAYATEHVQLLYATTVDTTHSLIIVGMCREALYVLATRAREHTSLYVATHDDPFDDDAKLNTIRRAPSTPPARSSSTSSPSRPRRCPRPRPSPPPSSKPEHSPPSFRGTSTPPDSVPNPATGTLR